MTAADPRDGLRKDRLLGLCERLADQAKEYEEPELWAIRAELMGIAHARPEAVDSLLSQARAVLSRYSDDDAQTVLNRIDASLAADQQKGGGEVVRQWRLRKSPYWYDGEVGEIWRNDPDFESRTLYTTPQPSSTAPAQQAGDEATLREALKLALEYWEHRQQRYRNRHPAWVQAARTALAHPPHADHKEPQS